MFNGVDNASGLFMPAHTNIWAVYVPGDVGVQDWEGFKD